MCYIRTLRYTTLRQPQPPAAGVPAVSPDDADCMAVGIDARTALR